MLFFPFPSLTFLSSSCLSWDRSNNLERLTQGRRCLDSVIGGIDPIHSARKQSRRCCKLKIDLINSKLLRRLLVNAFLLVQKYNLAAFNTWGLFLYSQCSEVSACTCIKERVQVCEAKQHFLNFNPVQLSPWHVHCSMAYVGYLWYSTFVKSFLWSHRPSPQLT